MQSPKEEHSMALRTVKSFERRWDRLMKLAAAQLRDFERDQKEIARQIKRHKITNDLERMREAVTHSRRVEQALKGTRALVARKDKVMKDVKKRGNLLKRALT
jgi:flagellar biosynthesis regulator FlbT